uniref:Uncharacterized protein n=1 Tax=Leersia perrieri TaxID=77586 RepID=A0A0D9XFL8_9ORYZ
MGLEESQKHLLGLSYHELQSLCKQYNLPANKNHSQLASSLALFLEDSGTRVSFTPVSSSGQGIGSNIPSQNGDGTGKNLGTQEHPVHLDSTVKVDDKISPESSNLAPNVGENVTDTGSGQSDKLPEKAKSSFRFSVTSDEGLDLFVDLNSTPSMLLDSLKKEVFIPSSTSHSGPGNFSRFISSLARKDDSNNSILSSGNITVNIQNKGDDNIAPCTNSSLGSTAGENFHLDPYLPGATPVNSMSSASTLPGTSLEISGSQEGVPVISSSCLTSDVQDTSHMTAALNNEVLPQESAVFSMCPERNHAPLADTSTHPTGNKDTVDLVKAGCTQNVLVTDTVRAAAFSSRGVVRSDSDENCPISEEKHEMINVPSGVELTRNGNSHEVILESEPVEAVPVDEDIGCRDRLSASCQLVRQTVAKLPVTDAQSEANSADHTAGSFKLTTPTASPAASDNAFSSKNCAESTQSSAYKKICDSDELEELEIETQPSAEPPRNILLSLRSASAKQTKPTLPRRSARLVPK